MKDLLEKLLWQYLLWFALTIFARKTASTPNTKTVGKKLYKLNLTFEFALIAAEKGKVRSAVEDKCEKIK